MLKIYLTSLQSFNFLGQCSYAEDIYLHSATLKVELSHGVGRGSSIMTLNQYLIIVCLDAMFQSLTVFTSHFWYDQRYKLLMYFSSIIRQPVLTIEHTNQINN